MIVQHKHARPLPLDLTAQKEQNTKPLNYLINDEGHLATHPHTISHVINTTQKEAFQRQAPTCIDLINHPTKYMWAIHQYPWHTKARFILEKHTTLNAQLATLSAIIIYGTCLKNLSKGKTSSHDGIPNEILKALPMDFHDVLIFPTMLPPKSIPKEWKHNTTILLYRKDNPIIITNNCRNDCHFNTSPTQLPRQHMPTT